MSTERPHCRSRKATARFPPRRPLRIVALAAVALAGAVGSLKGQDRWFSAPGPLADHPHARRTGEAAVRLAAAWRASIFPPGPVVLTSDHCPRAGARHEVLGEAGNGERRARVVVCAALVDTIRRELDATHLSGAVRDSVLDAVLLFTIAHETAHAFADLPAPGPADGSEAAADQFTALTLVSRPRLAHWAALYWARSAPRLPDPERRLAESLPAERPAYGREHGLDPVRMADLLCLVYGERPDRRRWMVEASLVAEGSVERCPRAHREVWERWGAILDRRVELPGRPPRRGPARAPGLAGLDTAAAEGRVVPADTVDEPTPWGEARALWSPYRVRVGDVVAPLLADVLRARRELPGRAVVTYEPSPGTLDVEIYGGDLSADAARRIVEDYRDYIDDAFRPYVERRFGPELEDRHFRILYYDASGGKPRPVVGLFRGEWVSP